MANQEFTPEQLRKEVWRDVAGYEGLYQVSNLGRVLSTRLKARNGEGVLRVLIIPDGYCQVSLSVGAHRVQVGVHRLVAGAFIGGSQPGIEVNHLNGIKTDNRVENLQYCTRKENDHHSRYVLGHTGMGEKNNAVKLTEHQVIEIRTLYATGSYSQPQLARRFGVDQAQIWRILHRRSWKHI